MGENDQRKGNADEGVMAPIVCDKIKRGDWYAVANSSGGPLWKLGSNHSSQQWQNKMCQRQAGQSW
jgi:hypothetical protein